MPPEMLEQFRKTMESVPDKEFKPKIRLRATPKPAVKGQPERSTQPDGPPPLFDPMQRVVPGSDESLAMKIENERNSDHNGALPLFLPTVGEDLDLKT
eukprot:3424389-Karenia_brevis.AAC.1